MPLDVEILIVLGVLAVFFTLSSRIGARLLTRRRPPDPVNPPSNYGLAFEEVRFSATDGTPLVGWWIPAEPRSTRTVIMCHGHSGSMDGDTAQAVPLHQADFNVFMFDFRAHGRSGGDYTTMGMLEKEDVLGALDYLAREHGITRAGVLGFSAGGAAAILAAALTERITAIVADSSFNRLKATLARWLARKHVPYPLAFELVAWTLVAVSLRLRGRIDQTDVKLWTPHVNCPILFIHGARDHLVTAGEVQEMARHAGGPTEIWTVPEAGHREARQHAGSEYDARVIDWFTRYL